MPSQFNEDAVIREQFPIDYVGVCIEVGAADGIASNTLTFEHTGWTAVCIEPNIELFKKCKKNRKIALNFAVGKNDEDNVNFDIVTLHDGNQTACSSLEVDKRLLLQHENWRPQINSVLVNVRTLNTILSELSLNKVDFVSIDTEGTELDVLEGFNLKKYTPKIIVVENNFNDSKIENYLQTFEYRKFLRDHVNDFYINDEY